MESGLDHGTYPTGAHAMTPTDTARCEPPEEWRERDGVHWLQYRDHPMNYADWIAAEQAWFFPV